MIDKIEEAIKKRFTKEDSGKHLYMTYISVAKEGVQIAFDKLAGSDVDILREWMKVVDDGLKLETLTKEQVIEFTQMVAAQAAAKALKGSVTKIELRVRDLEKTCQEHLVHGTLHEDEFQSKKSEYLFLKSLLPQPPKTK